MVEVDQLRREALEALAALSSSIRAARDALGRVLEHDPDVLSVGAEDWLSDGEYADRHFAAMGRECQTLLYMVTGLYGRTRVAGMAGVSGEDAEPAQ